MRIWKFSVLASGSCVTSTATEASSASVTGAITKVVIDQLALFGKACPWSFFLHAPQRGYFFSLARISFSVILCKRLIDYFTDNAGFGRRRDMASTNAYFSRSGFWIIEFLDEGMEHAVVNRAKARSLRQPLTPSESVLQTCPIAYHGSFAYCSSFNFALSSFYLTRLWFASSKNLIDDVEVTGTRMPSFCSLIICFGSDDESSGISLYHVSLLNRTNKTHLEQNAMLYQTIFWSINFWFRILR